MKKRLLLTSLVLLGANTALPAGSSEISSENMQEILTVAKKHGLRSTRDTVATAVLGGGALINLIDLCSSEEKRSLLQKAITGDITGRPRHIILARLGGSLLGFVGAWWVNHHRPFMRNKIKNPLDNPLFVLKLAAAGLSEAGDPSSSIGQKMRAHKARHGHREA